MKTLVFSVREHPEDGFCVDRSELVYKSGVPVCSNHEELVNGLSHEEADVSRRAFDDGHVADMMRRIRFFQAHPNNVRASEDPHCGLIY